MKCTVDNQLVLDCASSDCRRCSLPGSLSLDTVSARTFSLPGIYSALISKLKVADSQNNSRKVAITGRLLHVPLFIIALAVMESMCTITLWFAQYGAQRRAANRTERASLWLICELATLGQSTDQGGVLPVPTKEHA